MGSQLYGLLSDLGYHHPLHPALAHLPVGLTIASFIFIVLALLLKNSSLYSTSKHCLLLALLAVIPTIFTGYLDWQHFYGGALILPIKMKIGLAAALALFLLIASLTGKRDGSATVPGLMIRFLCLLLVTGLGYFGGEIVYGKGSTPAAQKEGLNNEYIMAGAKLFQANCALCHLTDSSDTKIGPGLKGLFLQKEMPVSGWPVSEQTVERQLKTPFAQMPPFAKLSNEEVAALTEYLKSL